MSRHVFIGSVLLAFVPAIGVHAQPPAPPVAPPQPLVWEKTPPGMTEIDGAKNPELIPDHLIWHMTFNRLAEIRRRGEEADLADLLPLSKEDLAALYVEAMNQRGRDESCEKRYRTMEAELARAKASTETADTALDDVLIGCRSLVLEAADRVLDQMSEDGRRLLENYHERRRRSASALVSNRELKNFRLPR